MRLESPSHVEDLVDRIESNLRKDLFDSMYALQERRRLWVEWDIIGLGVQQALLGSSLSLHCNLARFTTALTVGAGFGQFASPPAAFPAGSLRLFFPGRKVRFFLGYDAMNPFKLGPADAYYFFGPELGLSHDVGKPRGFKLHYALAYWTIANDQPPKPDDPHREHLVFPQLSLSYAF